MLAVFEGFAVIAGVILVGFVLGRSEVLGPNGQQVIAKLVFYAGTPTLLYVTVADTDLGLIFNTALLATGGSALIVGVLLFVLTRYIRKRSTGEAMFSAWAVSYVNIGNLGIPIAAYVLHDIGMMSGSGSEVLWRMADSMRCHLNAAPAARMNPMTMRTMDSVARSPEVKISEVKASTAMPPPMNARAVRIHDRNVRSLARVNRGSGSSPSGNIRRAILLRGSSGVTYRG